MCCGCAPRKKCKILPRQRCSACYAISVASFSILISKPCAVVTRSLAPSLPPFSGHNRSPSLYLHNLSRAPSTMAAEIDPALDAGNTKNADDHVSKQLPGITAAPQGPPAMATLQPNHPDQYRALPPPQTMYPPPYQQGQQMGYPPAQPAPRQRTAIACRYCRRRKVCRFARRTRGLLLT